MNSLDGQYQDLLQAILDFGVEKKDRTGTGTKSIFGYTFRHNMSWGFPLLTTKKMAWKSIVTELLWFLRGDTNIKYLVDNDCHIWDGDAYKNYSNQVKMEWNDGAINELFADEFIVEDSNDGKNINYRLLTQKEFIERIKNDNDFASKWGELGPIYGAQWRKWDTSVPVDQVVEVSDDGEFELEYNSIDQIINLINDLKTNPDSRRLIVSAWNVGKLHEMVLPPCHYGFQVYTRELSARERTALGSNGSTTLYDSIKEENYKTVDADDVMHTVCDDRGVPRRAISLMWNQRSVDTFLGLPFNIASYGLLLEILAKEVNMVPDELIGNLGDTHLYLNHIEQAKEQIDRESFELPKLIINDEFWNPNDTIISQINHITSDDFIIDKYQSHPAIKAPLSN